MQSVSLNVLEAELPSTTTLDSINELGERVAAGSSVFSHEYIPNL
jgi:hypothetical protein